MQYDGDILLTPTADGGDITWTNGQPDMDQGIETAVYLSLFSGPDWWGNAIASQYEKAESALEALLTRTLTVQTMLDAEEAARQALAWMVPAGVAAKVAVSASLPALGWLALQVTVTQPAGDEVTTRYAINWAAQEVRAWQ